MEPPARSPIKLPKECQSVCRKLEPVLNDYLIGVEKGSISYLKFYELLSTLTAKEKKEALLVIEKLTVGRKPLDPNLLSYFLKRSQKLSKEPLARLDVLLGPISMSYHIIPKSKMTGKFKKIYILGDAHDKPERTGMYSVDRFIFDLTEKFPGFIDIFLETEYQDVTHTVDPEHFISCWLVEVWKTLKDCMVKNRYLGCSHTSRIHTADIRLKAPRRMIFTIYLIVRALKNSLKLSNKKQDTTLEKTMKRKMDPECFERFSTFEGIQGFFKQILELEEIIDTRCLGKESLKISKQLAACSESFRNLLTKWTMENVEKFRGKILPVVSSEEFIKLVSEKPFEISKLLELFKPDSTLGEIECLAFLQDVYCLGRMFRTFPKARDSSDDFKRYHPNETENIVVYVGNIHAKHMREFLDLLSPSKRIDFPADTEKKIVDLSGHELFSG